MLNGWAGGDPNKIVDYAGDGSVMISGNNLVNALILAVTIWDILYIQRRMEKM